VDRFRLSPSAYRRVTLAALVALAVIVVTGAAVRLTGSGLGCPDWPTCDQGRVVAPLRFHAMVEFVNRAFTGAVSVAVIAAVLGSLVRRPRRRDLTVLSLGLVAGVIGQIVLGGITVLSGLNPWIVAAHFLMSMVLVWNAVVLHRRAGYDDVGGPSLAPAEVRRATQLLVVSAAIVLLTGTVVTGSGPHGGDQHVTRLEFFVPDVARLHGASEVTLLVLTLVVAWLARRTAAPGAVYRALTWLLVIEVAQAAVGYTQYFTGVPEALVVVHVLGATLVWIAVLETALTASAPEAAGGPAVAALAPPDAEAPGALVAGG